jgi:lincosamide nucleotidyltransferase A/C/D/E
MMTDKDVIEVTGRLEEAGLNFWLDGGWGVDALLGEQTRDHSDLDIVVELLRIDKVIATLATLGLAINLDDRPTRLVVADARDRRIDLHPITLDAEGTATQAGAGPNGGDAIYPAAGLTGEGSVGSRRVTCLTADLQLMHHRGYEPKENDRLDVLALCERFSLPLPPRYADQPDTLGEC